MALISVGQIKSIANKYLNDSSVTKSITYKSISKSFSITTGEVTETTTSISTRGLITNYMSLEIPNSGGGIQENDKKIFIREKDLSDNSITPKIGDRITFDSIDWEILNFEIIKIDDENIMYEFHCRV